MDTNTEIFKISSIALIFVGILIFKLTGATKQQLMYSSILSSGYFVILSI